MTRRGAKGWIAACLIAVPVIVAAQATGGNYARLTPGDIAAVPATDAGAGTSGVSGIRTRILSGDPKSPGLYTIALEVPANTRIASHQHRDPRSAVVVSGTWYFGFGAKADDSLEKSLGPGSFYDEPVEVPHFARTGSEPVTVYITGYGPTDTRYVVTN
jgi:uncharacterized RmlC-like cupin family protein